MSTREPAGLDSGDEQNVILSRGDKDWEWRRKVRSNPHSHLIYRIVVAILGLLVVVLGLLLVPFPGPGWLVVLLGLGVWASEFAWAQRLLGTASRALATWNDVLRPQPWWVKGLVMVLVVGLVAALFWLLFLISGVPTFFPDFVEVWLSNVPGLAR